MAVTGVRRRMQRNWRDTPLAKVFLVPDEWKALKARSQSVYVVEALKARNLSLWDAFTAFDADNNGVLSPSEFYGALVWLQVPRLTAEDVADFIEAADTNRDGLVDYREYMQMLNPSTIEQSGDSSEDQTDSDGSSGSEDIEDGSASAAKVMLLKIDPYGAEEIREVMGKRKSKEQQMVIRIISVLAQD